MRFMMLVKASEDSEAGKLPGKELMAAMGQFNEEMAKAGVMLAGEGLHPSSKGTRVTYTGGKRLMTDGPFDGEVVEVRQVFEASDFPPDVFPPEEAAREEALRAELQRKTGRP